MCASKICLELKRHWKLSNTVEVNSIQSNMTAGLPLELSIKQIRVS